jgi:hypothetical protein
MSTTDISDRGGKRPKISVKTNLFAGNGGETQHGILAQYCGSYMDAGVTKGGTEV